MSVRVDTPLQAGAITVGDRGLGTLASQVPSSGAAGPGFSYDQVVALGLTTEEVYARITTWPAAGDLFAFEDTSFIFVAPVGNYFFQYQLYVDGVATGSIQTVNLTIGGGGGTAGVDLQVLSGIRQLVGSSVAARSAIRQLAGADLSAPSVIRELVSAELQTLSSIAELVGASVTAPSSIRQLAGADLQAISDLRQLAGRDLQALSNIVSLTIAGASLQALSSIRENVGAELIAPSDILSTVGSDLEVLSSILEVVGANLEVRSDIRQLAGADLQVRSSILADVVLRALKEDGGLRLVQFLQENELIEVDQHNILVLMDRTLH